MESPSDLNEASLPFIREIVKAFPYFQPAQALYAKNLNNLKSIHYQNQLKITAAYSADRKVLYHLLMQEQLTANINKVEKELSAAYETDKSEEATFTIPNTELVVETTNELINQTEEIKEHEIAPINEEPVVAVEPGNDIIAESKTIEQAPAKNIESLNQNDSWEKIQKDIDAFINKYGKKETENTIEKPVIKNTDSIDDDAIKTIIDNSFNEVLDEKIIPDETSKEELAEEVILEDGKSLPEEIEKQFFNIEPHHQISELEKEILTEAISASIELDIIGALSLEEKKEEINETEESMIETAPSQDIENDSSQRHRENQAANNTVDHEENASNNNETGKHSFSEWLKLVANKNQLTTDQPQNKSIQETTEKINLEEQTEKPISLSSENINESKNKLYETDELKESQKEKNKIKSSRDIIENFIKEDPKISKPKKTEFFSPVNMARISVVEDLSFVTETLAKIYEKQGNYSKAIHAYENLILKYPEKNAYFAARIKAIKNLKDNK